MKTTAFCSIAILFLCIFGIFAGHVMSVHAEHNADRLADAMVGINKDYASRFWSDLWEPARYRQSIFSFLPLLCYLALAFSKKFSNLYFFLAAIILTPTYVYMLFVNGYAFETGCNECERPESIVMLFYAASVISTVIVVITSSIVWAYKNIGRKMLAPNKSLKDAP